MNEEFFPPDMYCWILNRLPARCTHCPEIAKKLVQLKFLKKSKFNNKNANCRDGIPFTNNYVEYLFRAFVCLKIQIKSSKDNFNVNIDEYVRELGLSLYQ